MKGWHYGWIAVAATICWMGECNAQPNFYAHHQFTAADTLRGMLRPERTCYDVSFYRLHVLVNPRNKSIEGFNEIHYRVVENFTTLQLDLFDNMEIVQVMHDNRKLNFTRRHHAVFVDFGNREQVKGAQGMITVYYKGTPIAAQNPPWDGGFVWKTDAQGKPWIGVACEGIGASLWYPNKDHLSDEPDSMRIECAVPQGLMCVANGNLTHTYTLDNGYTEYHWRVSYPINNYNVSLNIANYAHFADTFVSKIDGSRLPCDYYVLPENLEKAKAQFAQVKPTLESFEHYFGKYPFWNDGFALVETPYLGMEHQGAIAYGNGYQNGYLGGGGMNANGVAADYIIVHETGHEYFGNSLSCVDHADMWLHESFTTYMETLFVEYHYNYDKAVQYINTQRPYISNRQPIVGPLNVNWDDWSSSDHYYKGAFLLHTLRHVLDNDVLWWKVLRSFYDRYTIAHATTADFIQHLNQQTGKDFTPMLTQYLYYTQVPVLEYQFTGKGKKQTLHYRWATDVQGFEMPILLGKKGEMKRVNATNQWQTLPLTTPPAAFTVAGELFLVKMRNVAR